MSDNMRIYNAVRNTPQEAQKKISGGRINGFTDINPMYRIQRLTEQFGPCGIGWYYEPTRKWTEQVANEVLCFVDISLYIKDGNDWSKPIHGTGGSMIGTNERNGLRASDEGYKMATTDAISVACKQLGIGADVYWQAGESKYNKPAPDDDKAPTPPPAAPVADIKAQRDERIKAVCAKYDASTGTFGVFLKALQDDGKVARKTTKMMTDAEFDKALALVDEALNKARQEMTPA